MNDCLTCGAMLAPDKRTFFGFVHVCPPSWTVWCPEEGGTLADGRNFRATDSEEAAKAWAERQDQGEVSIAAGNNCIVHVCPSGAEEPVSIYDVSGEIRTEYYYKARSIA